MCQVCDYENEMSDYYNKTALCGKFAGVCVRPQGHAGACSNPPQPEDFKELTAQ